MKIRKFMVFAGLATILLAGFVPLTMAAEDGQFPVFPTVIGDISSSTETTSTDASTSTVPATKIEKKTTVIKQTKTVSEEARSTSSGQESGVTLKKGYVTNESGGFSPWGTVKRSFSNRAQASGEGVILTLTPTDAKPTDRGDLQYQIFYANNTADTLRNVTIQVFLPKNFQYLDSDFRPSSKGDGVVQYDLGKIASGETGAITLEVRARKQVKDAFISATMSYEDVDGNPGVVNATASNAFNGKNGNGGGGLSASILGGVGGFMLWLFVIILIIALAFVAYQLVVVKGSAQPRT